MKKIIFGLIAMSAVLSGCEKNNGPDLPLAGSYIDEYGVNHGQGIEIDGLIWAPVNCGYHKDDFKYGKLYQWGRKFGQGYDKADVSATVIKAGPVSLSAGQLAADNNVFFVVEEAPGNWLDDAKDNLWNAGTEESPVKTPYDPCPKGWRVPTYAELSSLGANLSSLTTGDAGQKGSWLSGSNKYSETVPQIFFPAAGMRRSGAGTVFFRTAGGYYWSSRTNEDNSYYFGFDNTLPGMYSNVRATGYSVRCVKE